MNKLVLKAPLNPLSFGNVSFNLLKEIFNKKIDLALFPIGKVDVSSFGKQENEFKEWIEDSVNNRLKKVDKNTTTLQMWHLNGSENRITSRQILYTFYELDSPTESERRLANLQDKVVFSSKFASEKFNGSSYAPLGFDNSFFNTKFTLG